MSVSVKRYLNTKKASKLSDDIKAYIEGYGNNYKAVAILRIAYKIIKQKENVTIADIEEIIRIIDNVYIEDNDNYTEKFCCYSKLVDCYLQYEDIDKLRKVAAIPFTDLGNLYISERLFYRHYILIISDVNEEYIDKIIKSEMFVYKNKIHRDVLSICEFINIILNNISKPQDKKLIKEITESNLISDILLKNTYISAKSNIDFKYKKSDKIYMEYLTKTTEDFEKDEKGYILFQKIKTADLNYYSKFCKNPTFCTSRVLRYRKYLIGNEVIFKCKECFKAEFNDNADYSAIRVTISPNTIMYNSGKIDTISGDVYNFFSYSKTEIFVNVKGKVRPALLKDLVKITKYGFVQSYIEKILDNISIEHPFAKDFKQLYKKSVELQFAVMPMSLNEIFIYHNWNEYFKTKYKAAKRLNYNYNKLLPSVSYTLIKVSKYIKDSDIGLLYNALIAKPSIADNISKGITHVIKLYYFEKCGFDDDISDILRDLIDMSINNKRPISLRIKSEKKVVEKHDKIMIDLWENRNKNKENEIIVKEESKYKELRKLLPPEYEWITTSKRLIEESAIQRHCVWQYEDKIKKDKCAIYSYVSKSYKRHTIEFNYDKEHGYFVEQIQKFRDRGYDEEVLNDINKILSQQKI